jgi:cell division protein FtsI/penicillin-binding protein 2
LARGLSSGDFTDVPLLSSAPDPDMLTADRADVLAGLGALQPVVEVTAVDVDPADDGRATATLRWTWDLGDRDDDTWTYDVSTAVVRDGDDASATWQAQWRTDLLAPGLKRGETLTVRRDSAQRGDVLAGDGTPVVEERPVWRVGIDPTTVAADALDAAARDLATALGLDADGYAARVAAAGDAFVEATVLRADADPAADPTGAAADSAAGADPAVLRAMPGVVLLDDTLPLAPDDDFAAAVLGEVGVATTTLAEESGGTVAAGELLGLSGLQRRYDAQLRGRAGLTVLATGAGGERELFAVAPVDGTALATTLDTGLQTTAEDLLADVPGGSALVALRPSTGDVLAVASGPAAGATSTATAGQFAPGSVFTVVSALAMLRAGLNPGTPMTCEVAAAQPTPDATTPTGTTPATTTPATTTPATTAPTDEPLTLRDAFVRPCPEAFAAQDGLVDGAGLAQAAATLGLDPDAALGFAAALGQVPDADGDDLAAALVGHGDVLVTPLGMATVVASIAAGHTVVPVLTYPDEAAQAVPTGTTAPTQTPAATPSTSPAPVADLTTDEAEALRTMMGAVVTEGPGAFLADLPTPTVYAVVGATGSSSDEPAAEHTWLVATHGDLAVAVFLDEPDAATGAALLRALLVAAADG